MDRIRRLVLLVVVVLGLLTLASCGGSGYRGDRASPMADRERASRRAYFVSNDGSDWSGDGSAAKPWASIQRAANAVSNGDEIRVAAGDYDERVVVTTSGSPNAPTRIVAEGDVSLSRGLVIDADYVAVTGPFVIEGGEDLGEEYRRGQVSISGDHNVISGIHVRDTDSGSGVSFEGSASRNRLSDFSIDRVPEFGITLLPESRHNVISDGTITEHGGWSAVEMDGRAHVVQGVTISGPSGWNTKSPSNAGHHLDGDGIRVQGQDMTIRRCTIHDMWEMYDPSQHTDGIQFWTESDGLLVDGCLIGTWEPGGYGHNVGATQGIMAEAWEDSHVTIRNTIFLGTFGSRVAINFNTGSPGRLYLRLYNCTFWSSSPKVGGGRMSVKLRNNIFKENLEFYLDGYTQVDSDYNLFTSEENKPSSGEGSHSVVADPLFAQPEVGASTHFGRDADFRPRKGSPVVGGAERTSAPNTDFSGARRDAAPDLGACELQGRGTRP